LGKGEPITKNNHALGRSVLAGEVVGRIDAYPTGHDLVQERWLAHILDAADQHGTLAAALSAGRIELRSEPGRAVLDGCGMTVALVQFRKRDTEGNWVIGAAMNRTQCRTGFVEFMVDPILVRTGRERRAAAAIEGYVAGTYCTESEWLSLRKLQFAGGVDVGDLLVFPNTAGYMMHFLESRSHQFELARNVFVDGEKGFAAVRLDDIDQP
jgi:diaminopimelate decarboxylase